MKSADHLYSILKRSPIKGYLIAGKRYGLVAIPRGSGVWDTAVARFYYSRLAVVGPVFPVRERESAWESFLAKNHPSILRRWKKKEEQVLAEVRQ